MSERSTADILKAAKARIQDQSHFVMGAWAWDRKGREVEPLSPDAARWNSRGAIYAESGIRPQPPKDLSRDHALYRLISQAARETPHSRNGLMHLGDQSHDCKCLHQVEDNLGHALTLQAFDRAIVLAEASQ